MARVTPSAMRFCSGSFSSSGSRCHLSLVTVRMRSRSGDQRIRSCIIARAFSRECRSASSKRSWK